jgi:putative transposase
MTKIGYRIEVEFEATAAAILDSQSKICNWLYNHLLEQANQLKQQFKASGGKDSAAAKTVYSKRGLRNLIPGLKEASPFLRSVYSSPLKNAALRLTTSIREYQKSRRGERGNGHKVEWPKFRSWKKKWFSLLYDEPWKGYTLVDQTLTLQLGVNQEGERLQVSGRLVEPLPYGPEQVKQLRLVKELGRFYAVFTVEVAPQPAPRIEPVRRAIALDPNHKNLAYGVDTDGLGIEIENMPDLKALDRRIDEVKGKRDHCQRKSQKIEFTRADGSQHLHWRPSRRWQRYNQVLQRLYRLRREKTKTYLYTLSNQLCRGYVTIGVGNYTPHGGGITTPMRRAMNNQSLIGRFKETLAWVCQRSGRRYVEYDERGSTRTCVECNTIVEGGIPPEVRVWCCPSCQTWHLRDENSGRHGLMRISNILVPGSGQRPVTITDRCTWRVTPTGVLVLPGGGTVPVDNRQDELNRGAGAGPDPLMQVSDRARYSLAG